MVKKWHRSCGFLLNKIYQKLKISNKKDLGLIDLTKLTQVNKSFIKEIKKI